MLADVERGNPFGHIDPRVSSMDEARPGSEPPFELVLWVESRGAIVIGDSLVDNGTGLTLFDRWIPEGQTREQVLERLRPLLELPVEIVLPTHGAPTDRAALERALT